MTHSGTLGELRPARTTGPARRRPSRRRRLVTRLMLPIGAVIVLIAAAAVGIYLAGGTGRDERALVRSYVDDWSRGDYAGMYAMLEPSARASLSEQRFVAAYATSATAATAAGVVPIGRHVALQGQVAVVEMRVDTRVFGTLREPLEVALARDGAHIRFSGAMTFPGLRAGEKLSRVSTLGARGTLEAANGDVLASGSGQTAPDAALTAVGAPIIGTLGPIPADKRARYAALGYPAGAQVGQDGLELIFQRRLGGRPGGVLYAGRRVLARAAALPGQTIRTTIDPTIQQAAIDAIAGSYAGIIAIDPATGGIEAAAGLAFTDTQPPGSTFKIITATAALETGAATPLTRYPLESSAEIGGYDLQNADGEVCGGTLTLAFAQSCNTTFAPLGIQLGGPLLVRVAEQFGFNHGTGIPSAVASTIPSASTIGDATSVGSSAIGQGMVQASPLEMADVAATIADGGRRPVPTFTDGAPLRFVTVTTGRVAAEVQGMMEAVVEYGTGTTAQISGVKVAGKTGTAELANTANQLNDAKETDAWFVGYAPAGDPKLVVCALYPNQGYGADSAAPAVREVLEAALGL